MAEGLRQPRVWLLALAHFLLNLSGYGFILWLPTIVQRTSGLPVSLSNLCSAIPFGLAVITALVVSRSSDRTGERRIHACIPMLWAASALLLSTIPGQPFPLVMVWLSSGFLLQLESAVLANPTPTSVGGRRVYWTVVTRWATSVGSWANCHGSLSKGGIQRWHHLASP